MSKGEIQVVARGWQQQAGHFALRAFEIKQLWKRITVLPHRDSSLFCPAHDPEEIALSVVWDPAVAELVPRNLPWTTSL